MADLGEEGDDVTTGSVLRLRGDVEVEPGTNLASIVSVPSGVSTIALHDGGVDEGDVNVIDIINGSSISAYASVSGQVGTVKFDLAHTNTKTATDGTTALDTSDWNDYDVIYVLASGNKEVQNIPQPLDDDGQITGKRLIVIASTITASVTFKHNTGVIANQRIFGQSLQDVRINALDVMELVYSPADERWHTIASFSVKARDASSGILTGRNLFMDDSAMSWFTYSVASVAGEIRVRPTIDNIPLTVLADQADDTVLLNIVGSPAPPTAQPISSLAGNGFSYNAITHAFDIGTGSKIGVTADTVVWLGMEGRISGADAGDFVGIDFTNGSGNVTFSLDTGAGGTFGVVANVTNLPLSDLEDISPGEVLGLQVDAGGDAAPVALTGLEQGENVRFNTISVIALTPGGGSGSGGEYVSTDFASNITSTTTHVVFTMTGSGTAEIDGFPAITGKILFVRASTLASDQAISWTNVSAEQASVDGAGRIRVAEGPRVWDQTACTGIVAFGNTMYELVEAPIANGYVTNAKLANVAAGTQKGRQIDAGTGAPVDLTGAEQFENLRRDTVQTETVSGTTDITLGATTTKLVISYGAATTIRGISGADDSGREVLVELFQNTGGTFFCDVLHASATPGGSNRVFNPNSHDIRYTHRDAFVMSARSNVWRVSNIANAPFFNEPGDSDRDILISDGNEFNKENLTTAVDGAAPGRLISTQVVTSSQTITPPSGAARCLFELQAAGGGGGGSDDDTDAGGGGGGGAYIRVFITLGGNSPSVTIGAAGSGGAGTSNGSTGTASSVTIGASTWTCNAGAGGQSGQNGSAGGSGGNVSGSFSGRLLSLNGESGRPGVFIDANVSVYGGDGGASFLGHSLPGASSSANGVSGDSGRPGSGGSGAASFGTTDRTGGTGAPAVAVFYFYS